jgi:hypothetical protein
LLKYLLKGLKADNHTDASWYELQAKWKGLNHYRNSRNWAKKPVKELTEWSLVPKLLLPNYEKAMTLCPDGDFILEGVVFNAGNARI